MISLCRRCCFVALLTIAMADLDALAQQTVPPGARSGYDRPAKNRNQSRSVTIAERGMVATSHPLAALAGLDLLKRGGNACDAAIAANAVLGVVEPMSCGIGGDLFCIYWDAKTQKLYGLNAVGRSPFAIDRDVFAAKKLKQIPLEGLLPWSVPGCVAGWDDLRQRFGSLPFKDTLADAVYYAEHGHPVSEVIAGYWKGAEKELKKWPDSAATFLPGGQAPREGDVFKNPNLARTLRGIIAHGRDGFYQGDNAARIVAFSERHEGFFSLRDLSEHANEWIEPVSTNYRGYDVWELPPPGQGIAVLQMLNLLEPHDIKSMGPNSADYLHLFVEAKKLAYADRAKFYADPLLADVPTAELISKEYAAARQKLLDMKKAAENVQPGDPRLAHGDTIYLTVVDKDRNCCSLIQSNFHGFGSKVVPGDVGYAMQNRGALFALDEKHLNSLEPHKRPFHTIIPAMVTKGGRPVFSFGVMGGDMQPQGHVQVLVNILDFGMNIQQAGDAARVQHLDSATPTGLAAQGSGTVGVESSIAREVLEQLEARGHRLKLSGVQMGGYQGIWIDWDRGVLLGASEARKDGMAVGY